jgi:hypothetical protein
MYLLSRRGLQKLLSLANAIGFTMKKYLEFLWEVISSPTFILAVATPSALSSLSNSLVANTIKIKTENIPEKAVDAIHFFQKANELGYECAYIDLKLQVVSIVVAFILSAYQLAGLVHEFRTKLSENLRLFGIAFLSLALYFIGIIYVTTIVDLATVELYIKTCKGSFFPPLESVITWLRIGLIIPIAMLTYMKNQLDSQ